MGPQSWLSLLIIFGVIEIVGVLVGVTGIAVELAYGADAGLILITTGGVVFGAGSGLWAKAYKRPR